MQEPATRSRPASVSPSTKGASSAPANGAVANTAPRAPHQISQGVGVEQNARAEADRAQQQRRADDLQRRQRVADHEGQAEIDCACHSGFDPHDLTRIPQGQRLGQVVVECPACACCRHEQPANDGRVATAGPNAEQCGTRKDDRRTERSASAEELRGRALYPPAPSTGPPGSGARTPTLPTRAPGRAATTRVRRRRPRAPSPQSGASPRRNGLASCRASRHESISAAKAPR